MTNACPRRLLRRYASATCPDLILEVIEGPDAGKRVVVDKPIVVGRDPRADFVLEDREVSRRHLRLTPTGDYVTVEDLGSANGTFVNHNELVRAGPARRGGRAARRRDRHAAARPPAGAGQALGCDRRSPGAGGGSQDAGLCGSAEGHRRRAARSRGSIPELEKFLDVRVRRRAVNAPWILAVLVALVRRGLLPHQDHPFGGRGRADRRLDLRGRQHPDAEQERRRGDPVHASPAFRWSRRRRSYPTGGSGTPLVLPLPNSVGTTAGDHQVLLSPDHTLLFAVNQGSNSIAVFHVNAQTGALTPVTGSPFSSVGMAPIALGYSNGNAGRGEPRDHRAVQPARPIASRSVQPRLLQGVAERRADEGVEQRRRIPTA